MKDSCKILVYGYGNPGRQDDGLGVLLSEQIEKWALNNKLECIHTDSNYQLNIEDAAQIADVDLVVFADASQENIRDFLFSALEPSPGVDFSMHSVSPAFILNLCNEVYHSHPAAYLLHIKGYEWEFMKEVTPEANINLEKATAFLKKFLGKFIRNNAQRTKIVPSGNNS